MDSDDTDDKAWQDYCRDVKPIHFRGRVQLNKDEDDVIIEIDHQRWQADLQPLSPSFIDKINRSTDHHPCGIDFNSAKKLYRGNYPIDVTLDLHHCTLDEGYEKLKRAVLMGFSAGDRVILVITGKGHENTGPLRTNLPIWCRDHLIGPYVLRLQEAHIMHGGAGAFYLLLRRYRPARDG